MLYPPRVNQPPLPPSLPPNYPPQPVPRPPKSNALAIVLIIVACLVGVGVVVAVLAALALPSINSAQERAQATMCLSDARQLHMATYRMVLDNAANPDPALGWPGDLAKSPVRPVTNLSDFFERLVEYKYVDRADLSTLLRAPGVPTYTGTAPFDPACSPFKVYRVTEDDADDCLFIATRNYTFGQVLDPAAKPFGAKAAVVCLKSGECRTVRQAQVAASTGRLPGGEPKEKPESVLKM